VKARKRLARAARRATYRYTTVFVNSRNELPHLLNRRGLLGLGAEIGVQQGYFSDLLLSGWDGARLLSIDPWSEAPDATYVDVANLPQRTNDTYYEETKRRLSRHGERSLIWRRTSASAARATPAKALDFVYLDARHDYASVKEDLSLWFDRMRPGGILAGHDYLDGELPEGIFGVRRAVEEFCAQHGLRVHETGDDRPWPTWVVRIPG